MLLLAEEELSMKESAFLQLLQLPELLDLRLLEPVLLVSVGGSDVLDHLSSLSQQRLMFVLNSSGLVN